MESSADLVPGEQFPDLDLPDHTGRRRTLSELTGSDPVALFTSRGWCPKEQRYLRELCRLQDEFEVAYTRIAVVSVDSPEAQSAFRAGLGARFTFLSDSDRRWLDRLGPRENTDTIHDPYLPAALRFDEPEVQQVRRDALAWWIGLLGDDFVCVSTFAIDESRCAGAVTVATSDARFGDDPFARLFPGTVVSTDDFSLVPPPSGPVIERDAGAPWPGGSFS